MLVVAEGQNAIGLTGSSYWVLARSRIYSHTQAYVGLSVTLLWLLAHRPEPYPYVARLPRRTGRNPPFPQHRLARRLLPVEALIRLFPLSVP